MKLGLLTCLKENINLELLMFETNYNSVLEKIEKFEIHDYARTRNFHNGHVSMLSPYLSRGLITVSFLIDFFSNKGLRYNQIYK